MHVLRSVFERFRMAPMKFVVTMGTVALGTGVLILAMSLSDVFRSLTTATSAERGLVVAIGNVETDAEGFYETVRPSQFDSRFTELVRSDLPGGRARGERSGLSGDALPPQ